MKFNQWTLGLAALGLVSLTSAARADEKPSSVMTALSSTTLSGYVDTSAQWNIGTGNANAPGYGFGGAAKADGFNLNVVDLNLEKDADAADSWGAGYRVELWMGPDANVLGTQSGAHGDFAVKNAYVDLKAPVGNGIDFKIGTFDTPIGYEVADSPNNPNFTRSYGFSIEPTTHTGILASYTVNDMISLSGGIANTFGPVTSSRSLSSTSTFGTPAVAAGPGGIPPAVAAVPGTAVVNESYKTYMAAGTFTASTNWGWVGGSTLTGCVINGFNGGVGPGATPVGAAAPYGRAQTSLYFGSSINTPLKELKVGWAADYVLVAKQPLTGRAAPYQSAYGVYATYQFTEKLSLNGRGEYFAQSKSLSGNALPSKVIELTATVQYDLWKNVLARGEMRWDHQAGELTAGGNGPAYGATSATGTGTLFNSFELLANVVYKF